MTGCPSFSNDAERDNWLDSRLSSARAQRLLDAFPATLMEAYPVSRRVNYAKEKGADVLTRAA